MRIKQETQRTTAQQKDHPPTVRTRAVAAKEIVGQHKNDDDRSHGLAKEGMVHGDDEGACPQRSASTRSRVINRWYRSAQK